MSTDRLLTDHRDLAEYPAESALLGIAMLAPERAGEIVDAVDLDLWGLPVLRDLMADLAGQVHLHGPQAVGFVGFTMHAIDRHPITARAMSGMLDDVMPWQAIAPVRRANPQVSTRPAGA